MKRLVCLGFIKSSKHFSQRQRLNWLVKTLWQLNNGNPRARIGCGTHMEVTQLPTAFD